MPPQGLKLSTNMAAATAAAKTSLAATSESGMGVHNGTSDLVAGHGNGVGGGEKGGIAGTRITVTCSMNLPSAPSGGSDSALIAVKSYNASGHTVLVRSVAPLEEPLTSNKSVPQPFHEHWLMLAFCNIFISLSFHIIAI